VEGVNDHDEALLTGRMSNNTLVHFPGDRELIGSFVTVKLLECHGFYYIGVRCEE
jgi:tRNA-2-methylthio-N6-dimethylallyladenosine synthase